ncbi:MAG: hypothetical protein SFX19_05515 [Alphaproteobacteria bacterium]|nr:hypothetical protein [Alphaproteobacteria bacterium]
MKKLFICSAIILSIVAGAAQARSLKITAPGVDESIAALQMPADNTQKAAASMVCTPPLVLLPNGSCGILTCTYPDQVCLKANSTYYGKCATMTECNSNTCSKITTTVECRVNSQMGTAVKTCDSCTGQCTTGTCTATPVSCTPPKVRDPNTNTCVNGTGGGGGACVAPQVQLPNGTCGYPTCNAPNMICLKPGSQYYGQCTTSSRCNGGPDTCSVTNTTQSCTVGGKPGTQTVTTTQCDGTPTTTVGVCVETPVTCNTPKPDKAVSCTTADGKPGTTTQKCTGCSDGTEQCTVGTCVASAPAPCQLTVTKANLRVTQNRQYNTTEIIADVAANTNNCGNNEKYVTGSTRTTHVNLKNWANAGCQEVISSLLHSVSGFNGRVSALPNPIKVPALLNNSSTQKLTCNLGLIRP